MKQKISFLKILWARNVGTRVKIIAWYRWLFKRCMDCDVKLSKSFNRGDVCEKCFDDFNGVTLEQLFE
jgi:hypothetical protein